MRTRPVLLLLGAGIALLGGNTCRWCFSKPKADGQTVFADAPGTAQRTDGSFPAGSLSPEVPAREGVFYQSGEGKRIELRKTQAAESKAGDIDKYLITAGLAGLGATYIYSGEHADLQIKEKKPTFYLCGSIEGKDAIIVQLTRKKDSRTVQTNSGEASSDNRMGYRRSDLFRVSLSDESNGCFSAKPDLELKPGEYLLGIGSSPSTYDFGIAEEGN
jgi:hypothetical protein